MLFKASVWLYSVTWQQSVQFSSVIQLFPTLWEPTGCSTPGFPVHHQLRELKLVSIESVMPFNHLIFCHPFLLLPSIYPSIRVFSNESVLRIRWPQYWPLANNLGQITQTVIGTFLPQEVVVTCSGTWKIEYPRKAVSLQPSLLLIPREFSSHSHT